ncbi:hypothetical protein SHKM778_38030 [Streptomyces sp. KM77-8]|uniref:Uncharacterized protein n=1 Tax=Streptomyces haneummycinicus TaxID=3074435 RepID=A0AAT9HJG6_9ACTN
MVVLHGHPHPLGADGDLHGEHRGQQRRVPYGVGDQLGDDQQQSLYDVVGDRYPWRSSRSRTAWRACGTEASTAGAVNRQTPSYGS